MLKNQNGVSLLEVMIAAGLVAIISLAVMKVSQNAQQVSTRANTNLDFNSRHDQIRQILANQRLCSLFLGGVTTITDPPDPATETYQAIPAANALTNGEAGGTNTLIQEGLEFSISGAQWRIRSVDAQLISTIGNPYSGTAANPVSFDPDTGAGSIPPTISDDPSKVFQKYSAKIRVGYEHIKGPRGGVSSFNKFFDLNLTMLEEGANKTIVGCYGDADEYFETACNNLGGNLIDGECLGARFKEGNILNTDLASENVVQADKICIGDPSIAENCKTENLIKRDVASCFWLVYDDDKASQGATYPKPPAGGDMAPNSEYACPDNKIASGFRLRYSGTSHNGSSYTGGGRLMQLHVLCCNYR